MLHNDLPSHTPTFGSIFADRGLHDIIQLIYPGDISADSILCGNSYDKAIRAHFLIDAAIVQHVLPPDEFSETELSQMKLTVEIVAQNLQEIDTKEIPITNTFQQKIENKFSELKNAGRTPALWSLYHYMVDTIKIFIRAERLGDFSLHLSCITNRMLHIFAATGHHHYARAARLYVQLMLSYEKGSPSESAILQSFKLSGTHVVRYSSYEWSGIWSDLSIEQTLMRTAKSDGGLSGGRFRNGESAYRCWVQTLSHMSMINRLSSSSSRNKNIHRDLATAQRKADEKAITLVNQWLEEMQPFDETRDRDILLSLSTGFFSHEKDGINPEHALEVGNSIQKKLDNAVPSTTIETKSKVKSLAELRKNVSPQTNAQVSALKYFNRLVIFAQRESNLEKSFEYELAPIPLSLFSEKDQLMHEANKATFAQVCLKSKVECVEVQNYKYGCKVIDGGWLLRQRSWEKGENWEGIISGYVQFVKTMCKNAKKTIVVFDGYESSTKDHAHRRRRKLFCHDMKIQLHNAPYTSKDKFLSNSKNKTELVGFLSDALRRAEISAVCCRDDADTAIVKSALDNAHGGSVNVRAEDADVLIMLVHHTTTQHHQILFTTSKGSYKVDEIIASLTEQQRRFLLLLHAFTGCDTVSSIYGFSKEKLFESITSTTAMNNLLDVFYNDKSSNKEIQSAGICIFQYIYKSYGVPLSRTRHQRYNKQAKAGVIRPESLPPTDSSAEQHSLRAYLQLQDWCILQSMSRDPLNYGWLLSPCGYEPVLMTQPVAPENLLKFVTCGCKGDCSTQRCSCTKNKVKCIAACGNCHGINCKNIHSESSET